MVEPEARDLPVGFRILLAAMVPQVGRERAGARRQIEVTLEPATAALAVDRLRRRRARGFRFRHRVGLRRLRICSHDGHATPDNECYDFLHRVLLTADSDREAYR